MNKFIKIFFSTFFSLCISSTVLAQLPRSDLELAQQCYDQIINDKNNTPQSKKILKSLRIDEKSVTQNRLDKKIGRQHVAYDLTAYLVNHNNESFGEILCLGGGDKIYYKHLAIERKYVKLFYPWKE